MPYCCQCGRGVASRDVYCANCGARQPSTPSTGDPLTGVTPRTASLLCYIPVVGWIAAIIVLASARFRSDTRVRFHAFQGLYLFVAWLLVSWVLSPIFLVTGPAHIHNFVPALLKAVVLGAWIFMIIKVNQDETFKLPIVGELAERSVAEQRI